MRRKCNTCLCGTCLRTCCNHRGCEKKVESCKDYEGFEQMRLFAPVPKYKGSPRKSWAEYGLGSKQYRNKLRAMCQSGKYDHLVKKAACQACEELAPYLIKCVTKGKSYDLLEFDLELGRIFVGKTSFYGILRYFYYLFDLEVRKDAGKV